MPIRYHIIGNLSNLFFTGVWLGTTHVCEQVSEEVVKQNKEQIMTMLFDSVFRASLPSSCSPRRQDSWHRRLIPTSWDFEDDRLTRLPSPRREEETMTTSSFCIPWVGQAKFIVETPIFGCGISVSGITTLHVSESLRRIRLTGYGGKQDRIDLLCLVICLDVPFAAITE